MTAQKSVHKNFKDIFKGIFVFPMSSRRQFRRLVVVGVLAFVAVVVFHLYFLSRIEAQNLFQVGTATPVGASQTVNEKKLAIVLQRYQDRATVRQNVLNTAPLVSEPSE